MQQMQRKRSSFLSFPRSLSLSLSLSPVLNRLQLEISLPLS